MLQEWETKGWPEKCVEQKKTEKGKWEGRKNVDERSEKGMRGRRKMGGRKENVQRQEKWKQLRRKYLQNLTPYNSTPHGYMGFRVK